MDHFPCRLTVLNMPEAVSVKENIHIEAEVDFYDPSMTLGFVFLYVPDTGELLRFAKKDGNRYLLTYQVPAFAPPGEYKIAVYATSDTGAKSETQYFPIRIL